jgi:hypothetical protein
VQPFPLERGAAHTVSQSLTRSTKRTQKYKQPIFRMPGGDTLPPELRRPAKPGGVNPGEKYAVKKGFSMLVGARCVRLGLEFWLFD